MTENKKLLPYLLEILNDLLLYIRLQEEQVYTEYLLLHRILQCRHFSCISTPAAPETPRRRLSSPWTEYQYEILFFGMKSVSHENPSPDRVIWQLEASIIESSLLEVD